MCKKKILSLCFLLTQKILVGFWIPLACLLFSIYVLNKHAFNNIFIWMLVCVCENAGLINAAVNCFSPVVRTLNFSRRKEENFTQPAFFFKLGTRFLLRNLFQERQCFRESPYQPHIYSSEKAYMETFAAVTFLSALTATLNTKMSACLSVRSLDHKD